MNAAYTIEPLTPDLSDEATELRLQSWLDTYVNDEAGISRDWIEARNERQRSPERRQRRLDWLSLPDHAAWIAMADSRLPIELGVITYNRRAIAFYEKHGFVAVPDSDSLFDGVIPEFRMVRPAQ